MSPYLGENLLSQWRYEIRGRHATSRDALVRCEASLTTAQAAAGGARACVSNHSLTGQSRLIRSPWVSNLPDKEYKLIQLAISVVKVYWRGRMLSKLKKDKQNTPLSMYSILQIIFKDMHVCVIFLLTTI